MGYQEMYRETEMYKRMMDVSNSILSKIYKKRHELKEIFTEDEINTILHLIHIDAEYIKKDIKESDERLDIEYAKSMTGGMYT